MAENKALVFAVSVLGTGLLFSCTSDIESAEDVLAQAGSSSSLASSGFSSSSSFSLAGVSSSIIGVSSSSLVGGSSSSPVGVLSSSSLFNSSSSLRSDSEPVSSSSSLAVISSSSEASNVFTDPRDGNKYKLEEAPNGRIWMSENLNYSGNNTLGYCYGVDIDEADPHRDASGCDNGYGRLYEWATAIAGNSPQGLCPSGWHIPNNAEWYSIIDENDPSRVRMPFDFYIYSGNFNTNSEYPPLGWKEKGRSGFYWTSSGDGYFVGFWEGPDSPNYGYFGPVGPQEIQSFENDGVTKSSVRCLKD